MQFVLPGCIYNRCRAGSQNLRSNWFCATFFVSFFVVKKENKEIDEVNAVVLILPASG
jgi:hypothetical protein